MKSVVFMGTVLVLAGAIGLRAGRGAIPIAMRGSSMLTVQASAGEANAACTPPMQVSSSVEQTAWQLFVASTCPVNNTQYPYVTWENWVEQNDLFHVSGAAALAAGQRPAFHTSPLFKALQEQKKGKKAKRLNDFMPEIANQGCNSSTWTGRTICEEVRLNPEDASYITSQNLTTKQGEVAFVNAGKTFQFPPPAVEVKADWIQLASCANPPQGVHVEQVAGTCYALGGIHLSSKLLDKWIWATFEPQNAATNPRRCQVLGCTDAWGSVPAKSSGSDTQLTPALAGLMTQANLAPEWRNYRLDGVQTDYLQDGKVTRLGNSIIEGENAGTPADMKKSSCITCHALSTITKQGDSMNPNFITGPPVIKEGYLSRDFSWTFIIAH